MKRFFHQFGYEFYLQSEDWQELSAEKRAKYNVPESHLTYIYNPKLKQEILITFDHFSETNNESDKFYDLCVNTFKRNGYEILQESIFDGFSLSGQKIDALKVFASQPNGTKRVYYFMRLSDKTPEGYLYGCVSTQAEESNDRYEAAVLEVITSWKRLNTVSDEAQADATSTQSTNVATPKTQVVEGVGKVYYDDSWKLNDGINLMGQTLPVTFEAAPGENISPAQIESFAFAAENLEILLRLMCKKIAAEYGEEVLESVQLETLFFGQDGRYGFLGEWKQDAEHGLGVSFEETEEGIEIKLGFQDLLI